MFDTMMTGVVVVTVYWYRKSVIYLFENEM